MKNKKLSVDDFEIYYKYKRNIRMKTYYMNNNRYFKMWYEFMLIGFDYLNIIDKLNLKRDYENLFKDLILTTLIQIEGIRPVKKEDIPKGVRVKKIYPIIGIRLKESGYNKYYHLINTTYLKVFNIDPQDKEKMNDTAWEIIRYDLDQDNCQITLRDVDYNLHYSNYNQWLKLVPKMNKYEDLILKF